MKKWFKGFLSLVLALVLVFSLAPTTAFADPDSGAGEGGWGDTGVYYNVEWLPHQNSDGYFDGIVMHLYRTNDGRNFTGVECRATDGYGSRRLLSDYAGYVQMDSYYGNTLDWWLDEAERRGYNGNERRAQLDFSNGYNDCYAQWTEEVEDGHIGEWAIYINLTKKPQGTWGYFVDTDGGGGLNGDADTYEFGIKPGETRTLPDGFWQANWQKRGDWTGWESYGMEHIEAVYSFFSLSFFVVHGRSPYKWQCRRLRRHCRLAVSQCNHLHTFQAYVRDAQDLLLQG
ncbi:MAG: hypothetical protein IJI65_09135 [Lachnospiraceae bacterium]|nr:hypothetical protein [Lachnospiraceae bacterium]